MSDTPAIEAPVPIGAPVDPTRFEIPEDQGKLIRQSINKASDLIAQLGAMELDYTQRKSELLAKIGTARSAYRGMLTQIAETAGLTQNGGVWDFDMDTLTYTKRP